MRYIYYFHLITFYYREYDITPYVIGTPENVKKTIIDPMEEGMRRGGFLKCTFGTGKMKGGVSDVLFLLVLPSGKLTWQWKFHHL